MTAGVVWDFGGVVFRWQPLQLLSEVLPHRTPDEASAGAAVADLFQGFALDSDWALFDLGRISPDDLALRIAQRCGWLPDEVRRVIDAIPPHLEPQAGTVALLHALQAAQRRLFYLSNMPQPYADGLERRHAFFSCFSGGIFSGRVGLIKPQPEIFELARERFGIEPAQSVFIDDNPHNIAAARALGWQVIHFQNPAQCGDALRHAGWL